MTIKEFFEKRRQKKEELRKKRKEESRGFFRDNTEAFTVSIIMALVVKQFAFEAYKVPTESMEPTIIGRDTAGDRIVVNKFVYMMRDPKRWEVVVFRYPLNQAVNYVKRLVGMPGEWLYIRNGDIFTADHALDRGTTKELFEAGRLTVQRKPDTVQNAIFDRNQIIPPHDRGVNKFDDYWEKTRDSKGRVSPRPDDDWIVFRAEEGATLVEFTRPATQLTRGGGAKVPALSNRRYDDWSPWAREPNPLIKFLGARAPATGRGADPGFDDAMCDVRLAFEVAPQQSGGEVIVDLRDGTHGMPIVLRLAVEGSGKKSRLTVGSDETAIDAMLAPDDWTGVSVAHYDDRIVVEVDGDEVTRKDYGHAPLPATPAVMAELPVDEAPVADGPQPSHAPPHENAVLFGFDGGKAHFRDLDLARDTYYAYSGATDFRIPDGKYLMFGDNSTNSLDARGWRASEIEVEIDGELRSLKGDAEGVHDRETAYVVEQGGERMIVNRPFRNPFNRHTDRIAEMTDANSDTFVDHFGNFVAIDPKKIRGPVRTYFDHYVAREDIMGRAYFTFWPLLQIGIIR